jgi:hypothetical protein
MANKQLGVDLVLNTRGLREAANELGKGLSKNARKWRDELKEMSAEGLEAGLKLGFTTGRSGAAIQHFLRSHVTKVYQDFNKAIQTGNFREAERLDRLLRQRTRRFKDEMGAISAAMKSREDRQARTFEQKADSIKQRLSSVGGLFRSPGEFTEMLRGAGGRLQEAGRARQGSAIRLREAGGSAKQAQSMAAMGRGLATVGKSLGVIGAVLGVVVLLVKAFVDLDDKMNELNKTVISTTGAMDFGFGSGAVAGFRVEQELVRMREELNKAASEWNDLRATTEQHLQVLAAYGEAGVRMEHLREEIDASADSMKSYADITTVAIAYSKLLGESHTETAASMAKIRLETGMTVPQVAEAYAMVTREAEAAGFSTKRFFSTVLEATSGLLYYNVRIQDATKLLGELARTLGQDLSAKVFGGILKQQTDSVEDALQRYYISGEGRMSGIMAEAGRINAQAFFDEIGGKAEGAKVLKDLGIKTFEDFEKILRDETRDLALKEGLRAAGMETAASRVRGVQELMRGGTGEMADVARGMTALTVPAKMAMLLRPAASVLGEKFDQAYETADVGRLDALKKQMAELGFEADPQTMRALADVFERLRAQAEAEGKTLDESYVIQNYAAVASDELAEQVKEDIALARQTAAATESVKNVLQENILGVLMAIHKVVVGIWEAVTLSNKPSERRIYAAAKQAAQADIAAAAEEEKAAREDLGRLTMAGAPKEDVEAARKRVEEAGKARGEAEARLGSLIESHGIVEAGGGVGEAVIADIEPGTVKITGEGGETYEVDREQVARVFANAMKSLAPGGLLDLHTGKLNLWPHEDETLEAYDKIVEEEFRRGGLFDLPAPENYKGTFADWVRNRAWNVAYKKYDPYTDPGGEAEEDAMRELYLGALLNAGQAAIKGLGASVEAGDLILPAGGRPIITHPDDMFMATRPGGPLAHAMGLTGGGAGAKAPITVNVYGGDQREVYRTVMRVLKATGNA